MRVTLAIEPPLRITGSAPSQIAAIKAAVLEREGKQ